MIRAVAAEGCDAARGSLHQSRRGRHYSGPGTRVGIAVLDSVAVTLWRTMSLAGGDTEPLSEWGRYFRSTAIIELTEDFK